MPFIGFSFDKIEATKDVEEIKGNINIKHSLNIKDVKIHEVTMDKKQDVLKFIFEFKLNYEPKVGNINLLGNMLYLEDKKKINEILANWKKNKKLPNEVMQGLFNTVLTKSNIKALDLAQDINLPPHLPMPKITAVSKEKYNEYIG
ncbi:MAG: hypothetical protein AABW56_04245 [Nanoarchaeota archaeon]